MNLKIATEFTTAPGPRYESEGRFSGEEFRKSLLYPRIQAAMEGKEKLVVDLDGTSGYGTSFLEEIFGGLIRENHIPYGALKATLTIVSNEEPDLLEDIEEYMKDAAKEEKSAE